MVGLAGSIKYIDGNFLCYFEDTTHSYGECLPLHTTSFYPDHPAMAYICAACGRKGSLICKGCLNSSPYLYDIALATRYCTIECQKANWVAHKQR